MLKDCVFCKIIRKELEASVVYEDNDVIAFLSNHPVNLGHTLVVPKKHCRDIYEISEEEAAYLFSITKRLSHAVRESVSAKGIRIVQNNGEAAGQVVFHLHIHIIPLEPIDDYNNRGVFRNHVRSRSVEELESDAQRIRAFLH